MPWASNGARPFSMFTEALLVPVSRVYVAITKLQKQVLHTLRSRKQLLHAYVFPLDSARAEREKPQTTQLATWRTAQT